MNSKTRRWESLSKKLEVLKEMEKREEIMNDFSKNYLLEAGAGAGKTTIIVERILNQIIKSNVDPSTIVAITFTKAASTELAERIQLKALEYLKVEEDEATRKRLESIDEIFTGTIHSFCDLILREMPFEANLTPGYEIIEAEEDFLNALWFDFIRNNEKNYKPLIDLLQVFNIDYRRLREEAILAMKNPDIDFVGFNTGHDDLTEIARRFEDIREEYGALDPDAIKTSSNLGKIFKSILVDGQDLYHYLLGILQESGKYDLDASKTYDSLMKKAYYDCKEGPDYENFFSEIFNIYHRLNNLAYDTFIEFINMVKAYKDKKFNGKLTFNDILYRASQLIKSSKAARLHFQGKYRHYYIDEFQDTDPMQAELMMYLTDEGEFNQDKDWEDCSPRPGSLFVVGDPKQSIYRFRRADITIYNQVKDMIKENGQVVYLDINFRSSDEICSWVEGTFKDRQDGFGFQENSSKVQAGFDRILSLWDDSLEVVIDDGRPQLKGVYSYSNEGEDYSHKEEEYVAKLVEDILRNYFTVEKRRKESGNLEEGGDDYFNLERNLEPKDIMILTKTNDETGTYLRALKARGIPALLAGEKSLSDTREVINLFLLLDALLDYRDPRKLIAALRNSFYLDLDTIDLFLQENKDLSTLIFKREEIEKISHPHIRSAFKHMQKLNTLIRRMSPLAFLETIVKDKLGIYNLNREYDNLESYDVESALNQVLETLKSKRLSSIYEIRNELEKLIQSKVSYELPLNMDFAKNAVRVMNIHKSKGLEGHLVFLVGRNKKMTWRRPGHYIEKFHKKNLGYLTCKREWAISLPDEDMREEVERAFSTAEDHRLLYVAATRAKSALIIAATEMENSFLGPLNFEIKKEISSGFHEDRVLEVAFDSRKEEELRFNKKLRANKASYFKLSPSQLKYNDDRKKAASNLYKSPRFVNKRREKEDLVSFRPRGKIYGNAFHRAMEVLLGTNPNILSLNNDTINHAMDLSLEETIGGLEINRKNIGLFYPRKSQALERILEINFTEGSLKAKELIKDRIKPFLYTDLINFAKNEEIQELFKNSQRIFPELQFSMPTNSRLLKKLSGFLPKEDIEGKKGIINGVIDLATETSDKRWIILDYKTDVIRGDTSRRLGSLYGAQLEGYGILLKEILKDYDIEIDKLLIYSTFRQEVTVVKQ